MYYLVVRCTARKYKIVIPFWTKTPIFNSVDAFFWQFLWLELLDNLLTFNIVLVF